MPRRSPLFDQLAEVIGQEAALAICREYGGCELNIPKFPRAGHALVELIGLDATRKLSTEFGYGKISPPSCRRLLKEQIPVAKGSLTEIARRFGTSRAYVSRIRRESAKGKT